MGRQQRKILRAKMQGIRERNAYKRAQARIKVAREYEIEDEMVVLISQIKNCEFDLKGICYGNLAVQRKLEVLNERLKNLKIELENEKNKSITLQLQQPDRKV